MQRPNTIPEAHRLVVDTGTLEHGVMTVTLRGEADLHTAPLLRDALSDTIEQQPGTLLVDMTGVSFIDSMMLGVLLSATRRARASGTDMRIVVDDPHVRRIFELTLLDRVLPLYASVDDALAPARTSGE